MCLLLLCGFLLTGRFASSFHTFFASIDNFKSAQLLYLTSMGVPATKRDMATGLAGATDADAAIEDPSSNDDAEPEDG